MRLRLKIFVAFVIVIIWAMGFVLKRSIDPNEKGCLQPEVIFNAVSDLGLLLAILVSRLVQNCY